MLFLLLPKIPLKLLKRCYSYYWWKYPKIFWRNVILIIGENSPKAFEEMLFLLLVKIPKKLLKRWYSYYWWKYPKSFWRNVILIIGENTQKSFWRDVILIIGAWRLALWIFHYHTNYILYWCPHFHNIQMVVLVFWKTFS